MGYYLKKYGRKSQKFQAGGEMMAAEAAPAPAPVDGGGMDEQQIIGLAEAAAQGDQEAAMELGMILAPMILEQAGAMGGGGGAPGEGAPVEGETPVFKAGGVFLGKA